MKYILPIAFILILNSCHTTCLDVKKHCQTLHCCFKITAKSKRKFIEFRGLDNNNNSVKFQEFSHWKVYESAEIGDTLFKELGKSEIKLIKKDTILSFPLECGGEVVE